ncbi:MAG TPA: radical SAM protein [Spirochaetota bacterium]|nr:radical SAM protein [Spirochaetota bacterium]
MPKKRITIPIFIPHTGCPHRCVFCNQWRVTGASLLPDRASVEHTVEKYLSGASQSVERIELAFFGGSFTGIAPELQEQFLSWIQPYIKNNEIQSIRLSTRPDYIDSDILGLLKRYGVETVELGIQSFDDDVLKASGRGHSSEDSVKAINMIKQEGFRTGIQLLPGLPMDTPEKSLYTAEVTVSLKPDDVRIYPAVVLKDTALENLFRQGKYMPMTLEETVELCSAMYGMFYEKGINVIRMGLHPMEMNSEDPAVVAGPYHTALGFMIKSRYRRKKLEALLRDWRLLHPAESSAEVLLPLKNREEYIGMNRENFFYLREKFLLTELGVRFTDNIEPLIQ